MAKKEFDIIDLANAIEESDKALIKKYRGIELTSEQYNEMLEDGSLLDLIDEIEEEIEQEGLEG